VKQNDSGSASTPDVTHTGDTKPKNGDDAGLWNLRFMGNDEVIDVRRFPGAASAAVHKNTGYR
jgi:hypothetical protein